MPEDRQELLDELLAVQRELAKPPGDDFGRRIGLRERLHELQAAVAAAGYPVQDEATLLEYLEQLEHRRKAMLKDRVIPTTQGRGISRKHADDFDHRIDQANDLPALDKEIARVQAQLAALGRTDP